MFRRFIIGLAELLQVVCIIVVTLGGAAAGLGAATLMADHMGRSADTIGDIGMVAGGVVGFVISVTTAAILFALAETARNTRRLVFLLQTRGVAAPPSPRPPVRAG